MQLIRSYLRFLRDRRDGVTAIEFALIAPILFVLIMGIIEFSLIMFASSVMETATASAARYGITGNTTDPVRQREQMIRDTVSQLGQGILDSDKVLIQWKAYDDFSSANNDALNFYKEGECGQFGTSGQAVLYDVSYNWTMLTPLAGLVNLLGGGNYSNIWTLHSKALVANERNPNVAC